jgi:hypothetical protein
VQYYFQISNEWRRPSAAMPMTSRYLDSETNKAILAKADPFNMAFPISDN